MESPEHIEKKGASRINRDGKRTVRPKRLDSKCVYWYKLDSNSILATFFGNVVMAMPYLCSIATLKQSTEAYTFCKIYKIYSLKNSFEPLKTVNATQNIRIFA